MGWQRYYHGSLHFIGLFTIITLALSVSGCQDKVTDRSTTQVTPPSLPTAISTVRLTPIQDTPDNDQPLPTITFIAPPPSLPSDATGIYDDFDDSAYEDTFNDTHFSLSLGNRARCTASQQNGVLVVKRLPETVESTSCSLSVDRPESVPSNQLEDMAISAFLASDHSGGSVSTDLVIDAELSDTYWTGQCGLHGFEDGPYVVFDVYLAKRTESSDFLHFERRPLAYDQWYRIEMDVDHETRTLSCLVDGFQVGTYSLDSDPYSEELTEATFLRWIGNTFSTRANGTILLDDFQLIPPL